MRFNIASNTILSVLSELVFLGMGVGVIPASMSRFCFENNRTVVTLDLVMN